MPIRSFAYLLLTVVLTLPLPSRAADVGASTSPATTQATSRIDNPAGASFSRRIIFVCDVSESMKNNMPALQRELGKAIAGLRPIQAFDVFLMGQGEPILFAPTYVGGSPDQKKLAQAFLDKTSAGGAHGTPAAIDMAIRSRPQLLYLLVDRDFPADAVRDRLRETNADHMVKINVIVLALSTEEGGDKLAHLKEIAKENGGTCRRMFTDPFSRTFGDPGSARKIAYVIDVSLNSVFRLKQETVRAIKALPPTAEFGVVIASKEKGEALPNDATLLLPTDENQYKAERFLDREAAAVVDPSGSIALAFSKNPDLVYLVSDGNFPDNAGAIAKIAALNTEKKVKINTIAFTSEGQTDFAYFEILKKIASDNGGTFRIVKHDDF